MHDMLAVYSLEAFRDIPTVLADLGRFQAISDSRLQVTVPQIFHRQICAPIVLA